MNPITKTRHILATVFGVSAGISLLMSVSLPAHAQEAATNQIVPMSNNVSAAAGPVCTLLGKKDLGTTEFPAIETPLTDGDIAFRQHSGGHTDAPNWPVFPKFASKYFEPVSATPSK